MKSKLSSKSTFYNLLIFAMGILLISSCEKINLKKTRKETVDYELRHTNNGMASISSSGSSNNITFNASPSISESANSLDIEFSGIRIQTQFRNFKISEDSDAIEILEKNDKGRWKPVSVESQKDLSASAASLASVLVLDMSSSVSPILSDLKVYAKQYIDDIVTRSEDSKIAVVYFSGIDNIGQTAFYDASNIGQLKSIIDTLTADEDATALFKATEVGVTKLQGLNWDGEKALVVFTDGEDTNTSNEENSISTINSATDITRAVIALEGDDFNGYSDIEKIVSDPRYCKLAKSEEDLKDVFNRVARSITSVYSISYKRSIKLSPDAVQLRLKIKAEVID